MALPVIPAEGVDVLCGYVLALELQKARRTAAAGGRRRPHVIETRAGGRRGLRVIETRAGGRCGPHVIETRAG